MSDSLTAVWFDIDGTLLDARGVGRGVYVRTLKDVLGLDDDLSWVRFAGATDLDILHQVADRHGFSRAELDGEAFFARMAVEMDRSLALEPPLLLPGVRELVAALARLPGVRLGLITGNDRACAFHKLHHAGLPGRFLLGGFGHEHPERDILAGLAADRMAAALQPGERIGASFLLGDTPRDARAAKVIGATAIGVATGPYSVADLLAAGCDHAVDTLEDTALLLEWIHPERSRRG
ncbi:MAG: haloacid dehalogenase-like hydrolase [Kiritimatiellia bacterium]